MTPNALLTNAQNAYSLGDLEGAERFLSAALQVSPNDVGANVFLGVVCARKGQRPAAISHLQKAISLDLRCYEAHVALSTLLFAAGQHDQAVKHGGLAIALQPSDPDSYLHLAKDLITYGRTDEAVSYLRQALKLRPSDASLIQDLANALTEIGQAREALPLWKRHTRLYPEHPVGWVKLGGIYIGTRQFHDAIACGEKAVSLDPESADARVLLGLALLGGDRAKDAETVLRQVIELRPDEMVSHSAFGLALHEMGRFDEARPYFERALEIRPSHGQSYYSLITSRKTTEEDRPFLTRLSGHLADPNASILDRSYMHYALGKAYEDLCDYKSSMSHFDEATGQAHQAWFANRPANRARYTEMIQATIETFPSSRFSVENRPSVQSQKPLLIVGMMRSGTTLVEQILSSHPQIKGAGELIFWHDEAQKLFDVEGRRVDQETLAEAAGRYIALLDRLGPGYARVIDKLPHNYAMLGFILAALPDARVIYVKRNAIDNCLSIFTTAFQNPPAFTLSRSNIVFGYQEHERIMAHWKEVLPSHRLLEVQYEDVVRDREGVTRQMIEFSGLEWDDACLHHESNTRTVNTPSVWQVRQPIYASSVERWRKFEPWLGEFRDLLDEPSV